MPLQITVFLVGGYGHVRSPGCRSAPIALGKDSGAAAHNAAALECASRLAYRSWLMISALTELSATLQRGHHERILVQRIEQANITGH